MNVLQDMQIKNRSYQKIMHILRDNIDTIQHEHNRKILFPLDVKNFSNPLLLFKENNNNDSALGQENVLYNLNKIASDQLGIQKIFIKSLKNFVVWSNLINRKILQLILNKNSQAEIHLKDGSLGRINIFMHMKDNAIKLNFVTQDNIVRVFLDDCMPFLRNSLKKEGIKLEKYNILSLLKNQKVNYDDISSNKYINNASQDHTKINMYEKKNNSDKYKTIDYYV